MNWSHYIQYPWWSNAVAEYFKDSPYLKSFSFFFASKAEKMDMIGCYCMGGEL